MRTILILFVVLSFPLSALARNVEPGTIWISAGPGVGIKMGSPLGGSGTHLLLSAGGEYDIDKSLCLVGSLNLGLAGSVPLRLRLGGRYRLADLGLPVSPFGQLQLSVGRVFDVIGANLTTIGAYVAGGADYFLTANMSIGGLLGLDLSSTLGSRPAFFGTFEILLFAAYAF